MNGHRLRIGIRTAAERSKALRETLRRVARGDRTVREPELYFESIEELRRILTAKRVELLLTVARRGPGSINELAEMVGRDYKNVSTDVAMLERLGLVKLQARGGRGGAQKPSVPYDEIQVTIDLRQPGEIRAA